MQVLDVADAPLRGPWRDPFSGTTKATSYKIRSVLMDGDVTHVDVVLFNGRRVGRVDVKVQYGPDGWVVTDIWYGDGRRLRQTLEPVDPAPPN